MKSRIEQPLKDKKSNRMFYGNSFNWIKRETEAQDTQETHVQEEQGLTRENRTQEEPEENIEEEYIYFDAIDLNGKELKRKHSRVILM